MTYLAWICERCYRGNRIKADVWDCPGCGHECCENCFSRLAHCKNCVIDKTDEALRIAANAAGWDFDPEPAVTVDRSPQPQGAE